MRQGEYRMNRFKKWRTSVVAIAAMGLIASACGGSDSTPAAPAAPAAPSAPVAEPEPEPASLAGETITLVVGVSPGGGYDAYVRLLAPFLADELGATVVVSNETGAGGLVALNNLLNSPADGKRIMLINGVGIAGSVLAGAEGVTFDLDGLGYVGRMYAGTKLIAAGTNSPFKSWEDVVGSTTPFEFGASGPGASTYVEPTVLMELLELDYKIITGYGGSSDIVAAMAAREVDGLSLDLDSIIKSINAGDAVGLVLLGARDRDPSQPDVPTLYEFDLTPEQVSSVDALTALIEYGRTLVVHPDTPEPLMELLTSSIEKILTSQSFIRTAAAQGRPMGYASADEVRQQVATILEAPSVFREIVKRGY